ncbi:hypothetical protein L915_07657, partial [Phytophthora nicotianae]
MSVNSKSLDDLNKQRRIQTEDERKDEREANAVIQTTRRSQQSNEEREVEQSSTETIVRMQGRHRRMRSAGVQRERDRERHEIRRALQTEEEREEERER